MQWFTTAVSGVLAGRAQPLVSYADSCITNKRRKMSQRLSYYILHLPTVSGLLGYRLSFPLHTIQQNPLKYELDRNNLYIFSCYLKNITTQICNKHKRVHVLYENIYVYFQNDTELMNILCSQSSGLLSVVVYIVTTVQ